jgi:hypothetical protein
MYCKNVSIAPSKSDANIRAIHTYIHTVTPKHKKIFNEIYRRNIRGFCRVCSFFKLIYNLLKVAPDTNQGFLK